MTRPTHDRTDLHHGTDDDLATLSSAISALSPTSTLHDVLAYLDSQISARESSLYRQRSITGDAITKASRTGSFTANAIPRIPRTSSRTADAIFKRNQAGSATANSVLRRSITGSFTANAVLQ